MGTSRSTVQNVQICGNCQGMADGHEEDESWLMKETVPDLTPAQFLEWYRDMGYGEFQTATKQEVDWETLLNIVGMILLVLNVSDRNPEVVARAVLPMLRGGDGS